MSSKPDRGHWAPDQDSADCQRCAAAFGLLTRRHHCRLCGGIFCAACSQGRMRMVRGSTEYQRVCVTCETGAAKTMQNDLRATGAEALLTQSETEAAQAAVRRLRERNDLSQPCVECARSQQCRQFLRTLAIDPVFLDASHDRCYCEDCGGTIPALLETEKAGGAYEVPHGWSGFGIRLPPRAIGLGVFDWFVSYHGCPAAVVPSVLAEGQLLMPGDCLLDGTRLPNRLTRGGGDRIQLYTSPSIKYALQVRCAFLRGLALQVRHALLCTPALRPAPCACSSLLSHEPVV